MDPMLMEMDSQMYSATAAVHVQLTLYTEFILLFMASEHTLIYLSLLLFRVFDVFSCCFQRPSTAAN